MSKDEFSEGKLEDVLSMFDRRQKEYNHKHLGSRIFVGNAEIKECNKCPAHDYCNRLDENDDSDCGDILLDFIYSGDEK